MAKTNPDRVSTVRLCMEGELEQAMREAESVSGKAFKTVNLI